MTISRLFLSVFMLGFVFLASCSKDEGTTGTDTFTSGMVAKVDGVDWNGNATGSASMVSGNLNIQSSVNGQVMQIAIYNVPGVSTPGVGTFSLAPVNGSTSTSLALIMEVATQKTWSTMSAGSGSVTITKMTSTDIEGTFNFNATGFPDASLGTKNVTEGKFALKLTVVP